MGQEERVDRKGGGLRVLVCGGRDFGDGLMLDDALSRVRHHRGVSHLIHGGARGADALADVWARYHGVPRSVFFAQWHTHGKAAGPIRNQRMLDEGKLDLVVAFPGGRGTEDMVRRATEAGVRVWRPLDAHFVPPDPPVAAPS